MEPDLLYQCRRQITGHRRRQAIVTAIALTTPVAVVLAAMGWAPEALLLLGISAIVGAIASLLISPSEAELISEMNRQLPELEYSTRLLAEGQASESLLARLQRERTRQRLSRTADRIHEHLALPVVARSDRGITAGLLLATPLAAVALTVGLPIRVAVSVVPPAYTGLPAFSQSSLRIEAPQGSALTVSVRSADQARLDGLESRRMETRYATEFSIAALESSLFELHPVGTGALTVIPDRPPIALLGGQEKQEFAPGDTPLIALEGTVSDDYGLSAVNALATVARGDGEAVKFRDVRIPVSPDGNEIDQSWSAESFDMEPGDELYLRIEAVDNRTPNPQRAVSQAMIVRWLADDVESAASIEGIIIDRLPEYFRSQRQIIIDTEALIALRSPREEKLPQSQQIAFDQRNLRLRYGQYLGEEDTTDIGPTDILADDHEDLDGHEDHEDHEDHDDHDEKHDNVANRDGRHYDGHAHEHHDQETTATSSAHPPAFLEAFVHAHDSFLTNTMFDSETRDILISALNAMWKAEMELGLGDPEAALPWEYEALKNLKRVQQAGRIYVKRVGFEPPPLSEEKRLTGELDEASNTRIAWRTSTQEDPMRVWLQSLVVGDMGQAISVAHTIAGDPALPIDLRNAAVDFAAAPQAERGVTMQRLRQELSPPLTAPGRREAH